LLTVAKTDQELAQEALAKQGIDYKYGGDTGLAGPFMPIRRQIIRPEQQMFEGYNVDGTANIRTIPAEYGPAERDLSYAPAMRGLSFLRDLVAGDANEQNAAIGKIGTALRGIPEYFSGQVEAAKAGGTTFDPETQTLTEFDPTSVPALLAPAGVAGYMSTPRGAVTLGSMGSRSRRKGMTLEEGQADAMKLLDEALEAPIEDFKPLEGAPKYSGPMDSRGAGSSQNVYAIVTAENPPNVRGVTDEYNKARTRELGERLIRDYGADNVSLVKGDYGGAERSFMVMGMDPISARNIGDKYGQDSVFTDRGIIYTRGNPDNRRGEITPLQGTVDDMGREVIKPEVGDELDSFYTEMDTGDGNVVRFRYDLNENEDAIGYTPLGRPAAASARGVHFSNEAGLTELDPIKFGTGHRGAEHQRVGEGRRAYGEGPLRSYFYTPSDNVSDVRPEAVVTGPNRYQTTLRKLYDAETDPEGLRALSKNPSDFERMVEARGYRGIMSPVLSDPSRGRSGSAAVFQSTPVTSLDTADMLGGKPR
jgi:hypothetical protein